MISKYCSKGDELCKLDTQGIFLQWNRKGLAKLGTKTRRGFSKMISGLELSYFTISTPREAKICQSFFDCVVDPSDTEERLELKKLGIVQPQNVIN